jgi:hypothetical protein
MTRVNMRSDMLTINLKHVNIKCAQQFNTYVWFCLEVSDGYLTTGTVGNEGEGPQEISVFRCAG